MVDKPNITKLRGMIIAAIAAGKAAFKLESPADTPS